MRRRRDHYRAIKLGRFDIFIRSNTESPLVVCFILDPGMKLVRSSFAPPPTIPQFIPMLCGALLYWALSYSVFFLIQTLQILKMEDEVDIKEEVEDYEEVSIVIKITWFFSLKLLFFQVPTTNQSTSSGITGNNNHSADTVSRSR